MSSKNWFLAPGPERTGLPVPSANPPGFRNSSPVFTPGVKAEEEKPVPYPPVVVLPALLQAVRTANKPLSLPALIYSFLPQGQAFKLFWVLQIFLFMLALNPGIIRAEAGPEELKTRITSLYQTLQNKDIRNYHVRDEISGFFQNPDDLSQYLVSIFVRLEKIGSKDFRIRNFKIQRIDFDDNEARVTIEIRSYYFLFLKKTFSQVDRWKLLTPAADKKDWYLVPLPIKEGSE